MYYRFGIRFIDMVIYRIDLVILDIDVGYGLMIWEMALALCEQTVRAALPAGSRRRAPSPLSAPSSRSTPPSRKVIENKHSTDADFSPSPQQSVLYENSPSR